MRIIFFLYEPRREKSTSFLANSNIIRLRGQESVSQIRFLRLPNWCSIFLSLLAKFVATDIEVGLWLWVKFPIPVGEYEVWGFADCSFHPWNRIYQKSHGVTIVPRQTIHAKQQKIKSASLHCLWSQLRSRIKFYFIASRRS